MAPSSLVFLVIIGVWAAYFVQYWVRRREHLATVHAVDQFSESMRILDRQSTGDGVAEAAPRASRPQTLLKRTATVSAEAEPDAAPRASAAAAVARRGSRRRRRGLAVLVALAALLISATLAALGIVPIAVVLPPVAALLVSIVWVRRGAAAERAARRVARQHPRRQADSTAAARRAAAPQPLAEPSALPASAVAEVEPEPHVEQQPLPVREELYDLQQVEQTVTVAARPGPARMQRLVDEDDIPLTWDPVPVPRPTYTMKSRVTRPAPTAADLVGDADTEYADKEYTAYEDDEQVRRVAGA